MQNFEKPYQFFCFLILEGFPYQIALRPDCL